MDIRHSFFLRLGFAPLGFIGKVFNETVIIFLWSPNGECYKMWEFVALWKLMDDNS